MDKMNCTYGYVRVSTREQNLDRQIQAMKESGIPANHIFQDKLSGKDFDRPQYTALLHRLRKGDTLVIKSIDRLGRNYEEILQQWRYISKELGVNITVLDMPLLNTVQEKDLTGVLIADIVLQLLSYVAQTEREFIHQRQAEGIAAAKKRGVVFGRSPMSVPEEFPYIYAMWRDHKLSARQAAVKLGVHHKTFLKWVRSETSEAIVAAE